MNSELRIIKTEVKNELKKFMLLIAQRLKEEGWSNKKIGKLLGLSENSIRSLLKR